MSRYLSEPVLLPSQGVPPLHTGSELFHRFTAILRWIRRGRGFDFLFPRPRQPFDRLDFYTLRHPLVDRLKFYDVTEPHVSPWRGFTWGTLIYWQDLMSGEHIETREFEHVG